MYKHNVYNIDNPTRSESDIVIYRKNYIFVVEPYIRFGAISKDYKLLVDDNDCIILNMPQNYYYQWDGFKMIINGTEWY